MQLSEYRLPPFAEKQTVSPKQLENQATAFFTEWRPAFQAIVALEQENVALKQLLAEIIDKLENGNTKARLHKLLAKVLGKNG
jgi:hypothetical protein